MTTRSYSSKQLLIWLAVLLGVFFLIGLVYSPAQKKFVSAEVTFTDPSTGGLHIMPASCSSHPSYTHGTLAQSGGTDFIIQTGQSEYGAYKNGVYICVTNQTGSHYFVPGGTAAEMNAFKSAAGPIPNLDAW
jgi:hypothetical protein